MNPFTRFLNQWSTNRSLDEFIAHWDVLERVVIMVYRQKLTPGEAEEAFNQAWPWLRRQMGQWEGALRPFWMQTVAGGQPTQTDPFHLLLAFQKPADILGDWRAMQHLPAAREALNRLLLAASDNEVSG